MKSEEAGPVDRPLRFCVLAMSSITDMRRHRPHGVPWVRGLDPPKLGSLVARGLEFEAGHLLVSRALRHGPLQPPNPRHPSTRALKRRRGIANALQGRERQVD